MSSEEFSVAEWYPDGTYTYVARWIDAESAMQTAKRVIERANEQFPIVRVIVTDGGDSTVFDWREGLGIVWPARGPDGKFVADGPEPPPWP